MERKLTTIFCADVVGFSKMMGADEEGTLQILQDCRTIIDPMIISAGGRIFGSAGDSVLAEFSSAVNAVKFAIACQAALHVRNLKNSKSVPMTFRMGINLGDVVVQGTNLFGDGVNVAARLESMADYGGISIAENVHYQVHRKLKDVKFVDRGEQRFKNIVDPIHIYAIEVPGSVLNPASVNVSAQLPPAINLINVSANSVSSETTMSDVRAHRKAGELGKAIKICLAMAATGDSEALEELLDLAVRKHIPKDLLVSTAAVFIEFAKCFDSSKQSQIGNLFASEYFKSTRMHP